MVTIMQTDKKGPVLKKGDIVVVSIANPATRITGVIKSEPILKYDGEMQLVHWADGDKSWWRADRLELHTK